jgi:hypothetical protein
MGYGKQDHRWVTDAPIETRNGEKAHHVAIFDFEAKMLAGDIEDFAEGLVDPAPASEEDVRSGKVGSAVNSLRSDNIEGAKYMSEKLTTHGVLGPGRVGFVYVLAGRPLALMVMQCRTGDIFDLLCHPGALGAGGIMIEFAVNYRCEVERVANPILKLTPLRNARNSYREMGFEGVGSLRLDLTKPQEKWKLVGSVWHYVSSRSPNAAGYLSTDAKALGTLPPLQDD